METINYAKHIQKYVLKIRRELHMHPELSGQEYRTKEIIMNELKKSKIEFEEVADNSIVAFINRKKTNKSIGFMSGIDGLPIQEETKWEYTSKNSNVFHCTGNDAHIAVLLGIAKFMSENSKKINGKVILIFEQQSSQLVRVKPLLEHKEIRDLDMILYLHNLPEIPSGYISFKDGIQLYGCNILNIEWFGEKIHVALANKAKNAIKAALMFAENIDKELNSLITPDNVAKVAISRFVSDSYHSIVPSYAEMDVNIRYNSESVYNATMEKVEKLANFTSAYYNVDYNMNQLGSAKIVYNNSKVVSFVKDALNNTDIKFMDYPPLLNTSNFSNYLEYIPGAFIIIGSGFEDKENFPCQSSKFFMNEEMLLVSLNLHLQIIFDYFNR